MSLTSGERRQYAAIGQRLKAQITLGDDELTDGAVEHVRRAFDKDALVKVRIRTKDRNHCAAVADALASRVPCDLVQQIGRVALFHRAAREE